MVLRHLRGHTPGTTSLLLPVKSAGKLWRDERVRRMYKDAWTKGDILGYFLTSPDTWMLFNH